MPAVCALVLASAGFATAAFAEPPISEPATTTLALAAPAVIAAHESTTVVATLEQTAGVPVAGRAVVILRSTSTTETTLAAGFTDSDGHFSAVVQPTSRLVVRATFAGDIEYLASESATAAITPKVALSKPWTHDEFASPGQWLPARGTLWPKHSKTSTSTRIVCERKEDGKWVVKRTFPTKITNKNGKSYYAGKFRIPSTGSWRVRVRHDDVSHARSYSKSRYVTVTNWRKRYVGKRVHGLKPPRKMVAITIDDGPNARSLAICSILEKYDAKGTFFFVRRLMRSGYLGQTKKIYDRGHEVENHTARHDMLMGPYADNYASIASTKATIHGATGYDSIWVRPMGGGINATGDRAIRNAGQLCAIWSVDSYDSHAQYTAPDKLYHNVVDHVRSGDVILIHQTHPETVKALPRICATLKARGYKMVTLSKMASVSRMR